MNYGEFRDAALMLADRYSTGGAALDAKYNNQADRLIKLPYFADSAQLLIATTARPIAALASLIPEDAEGAEGAYLRFSLPEDCWRLTGRGLGVVRGGEFSRSGDYLELGGGAILVPRASFGAVTLEYYRYPRQLGPSPEDGAELDNVPEAQAALPCYAAAQLMMNENNSFAYSALMGQFEARLERMRAALRAQEGLVRDAYGGPGNEA